MPISKTVSILAFASFLFIVSTVIAQEHLAPARENVVSIETATSGEDALFVGMLKPTKGTAGLPAGLSEDDFQLTGREETDDARTPASIRAARASRAAQKTKKAAKATKGSAKTHWSAQASDGFQYKIRIKKQVSAVWVLKRNDRYDLIFANNAGSRVNLTIPPEQFYALKNAASELRAPASDTTKCKDGFMQLEMVEASSRKLVATCLSTKSKQAESLRAFGTALTAYVR